ncbi:hypothetical protein B0H14DRAFT_2630679 [Mycena olivaceomarginata]|nr:hypothetical protein B0H14DRAFT_2630679 [Mycena olivaceomarginata]
MPSAVEGEARRHMLHSYIVQAARNVSMGALEYCGNAHLVRIGSSEKLFETHLVLYHATETLRCPSTMIFGILRTAPLHLPSWVHGARKFWHNKPGISRKRTPDGNENEPPQTGAAKSKRKRLTRQAIMYRYWHRIPSHKCAFSSGEVFHSASNELFLDGGSLDLFVPSFDPVNHSLLLSLSYPFTWTEANVSLVTKPTVETGIVNFNSAVDKWRSARDRLRVGVMQLSSTELLPSLVASLGGWRGHNQNCRWGVLRRKRPSPSHPMRRNTLPTSAVTLLSERTSWRRLPPRQTVQTYIVHRISPCGLAIYKQINSQASAILSDINDNNLDHAFDFLRSIVQGTADTDQTVTGAVVQCTTDFLAPAIISTRPE